MGVDIVMYRVAIGLFVLKCSHSKKKVLIKISDIFNSDTYKDFYSILVIHFKITSLVFALTFLNAILVNRHSSIILLLLLLICMDVHPNPGPQQDSEDISIFHLQVITKAKCNQLKEIGPCLFWYPQYR